MNKKRFLIFKGFKSKKFRKSTRFSFFNKNNFKKKICYQDLRKYLLVNQTAEPDCFVSFSNKTYKDFWWGEKTVETLKIFKQPLGNWYRLYLPRLEQNKNNREWLFPDKIFNQHISLLDLNRLMHHVPRLAPTCIAYPLLGFSSPKGVAHAVPCRAVPQRGKKGQKGAKRGKKGQKGAKRGKKGQKGAKRGTASKGTALRV